MCDEIWNGFWVYHIGWFGVAVQIGLWKSLTPSDRDKDTPRERWKEAQAPFSLLGFKFKSNKGLFLLHIFLTDGCHYMRVLIFWRQVFSMSQLLQEFREEEIDETSDNWAANWQHSATTSVAEWLRHTVHETKTCCWLPIFKISVATQ